LEDNHIARIGLWKFMARTHKPELDWCGLIDVRYALIVLQKSASGRSTFQSEQ
jgi:hypothetical protein